MAKKQFITCPHCEQPLTVAPIGNGTSPKTFENSTTSFAPDTQAYYLPDEMAHHRPWWEIDGVAFITVAIFTGSCLWFVFWWLGWSSEIGGAAAAIAAMVAALGLHVLRLRWRSPSPPAADETIIKVQVKGHDPDSPSTIMLDAIQDKTIRLDELRRVAGAIDGGANFSRYQLVARARISNGKYRKILDEFRRLNFAYTDTGNNTHLTWGGRAFLRQLLKAD